MVPGYSYKNIYSEVRMQVRLSCY